MADSAHTSPPPNVGSYSQLNPFTPEWFAQVLGAATTAAATAAATAVAGSRPVQSPPSTPSSSAPRRLNERKIPDFWEDRQEYWFRIIEAHLSHFNPSEKEAFNTMLPLMTAGAVGHLEPVVHDPGAAPYTTAKAILLTHYGKTPQDRAREFRGITALGDRLPCEFLKHLKALCSDLTPLYEVTLLDALPDDARAAAILQSTPEEMAIAAERVIKNKRAAPAPFAVTSVDAHAGRVEAVAIRDICPIHARYGAEAFRCSAPKTCKMRDRVVKLPPSYRRPHNASASASATGSSLSASGNFKAGGHQ